MYGTARTVLSGFGLSLTVLSQFAPVHRTAVLAGSLAITDNHRR